MSAYEIRAFEDRDLESLLATWAEVFGGDGMPRAAWDWKFRTNPAGARVWVALHCGEVVAQYAAMPHRVWLSGREVVFSEIVDSMVHPDHRRGLKRPGLFVELARPMLEAIGGPDADFVCYGWPAPSAWRIGSRYLGYELLRTQSLLVSEVGSGATEPPAEVERLERFDHQARWLWERCCGVWGASTIRDDAFLNWRFVDRPDRSYDLFGVRDAEGVLRGFAALHVGPWAAGAQGVLADWLVPPDEPEVARALLAACRARVRQVGLDALTAVLPEWSEWYAALQREGFRVFESDLVLAARPFVRKFDTLWLREHWWTTLADSDQV